MSDVPTLQTLVDIKPPVSDDAIYMSLRRNKGNISAVATELDRTWATIKKRIDAHPELREVADEYRQNIVDKAEQNIFDAVESGDLIQSALVVRTLGKGRGWNTRTEHTGEEGGAMVVKIEGDAANV